MECEHCAALSEPLMKRHCGLAALLPVPGLRRGFAWIAKHLRTPQGQITAAVSDGVAAVAVAAMLAGGPAANRPLSVDGRPVAAQVAATSRNYLGKRITAHAAPVLSVPADEGFWLGSSARARVWVELTGTPESSFKVRPGDKVSFVGKVVRNARGFARPSA